MGGWVECLRDTGWEELGGGGGVDGDVAGVERVHEYEYTGEELSWRQRRGAEGPCQMARPEIAALEFFTLDLIEEWLTKQPGDFAPGFIECWRAIPRVQKTRA